MPLLFERGMRRRWSNLQYHYNIKHRKKGTSWTEKRGRERAEPSVIDAIRHKMMIITNLGSCLKMVKKGYYYGSTPSFFYGSYPSIFSILFLIAEVEKAILLISLLWHSQNNFGFTVLDEEQLYMYRTLDDVHHLTETQLQSTIRTYFSVLWWW